MAPHPYSNPLTLGTMAMKGMDIWVRCGSCGHTAVLAITVFIRRLGADCAYLGVRNKLRCSECGARDVDTRPHSPRQ